MCNQERTFSPSCPHTQHCDVTNFTHCTEKTYVCPIPLGTNSTVKDQPTPQLDHIFRFNLVLGIISTKQMIQHHVLVQIHNNNSKHHNITNNMMGPAVVSMVNSDYSVFFSSHTTDVLLLSLSLSNRTEADGPA